MYYVRKLSNPSSIHKLRDCKDINSIDADILGQEFRTSHNTLSFWKCEDINKLEETFTAILLSTTAIKVSQFIIVNESEIERYGLSMDDSEPGQTGYKNHESLHINMVDLTYEKIGKVISMLKELTAHDDLIPKLEKDKVKGCIEKAIQSEEISYEILRPELQEDIRKYFKKYFPEN